MEKKNSNGRSKTGRLVKAIKEAHKDPKTRSEIKKFIKITTGVYNLKDYGLK